jgi:flagellar motor protein MotB
VVIVQAVEGKTLGSWGTPQGQDALEVQEWPRVYRARNERQAHRCKDMINHGALNINDGRKKRRGADRHHQRKQAQRAQALETARKRGDKKAAALKGQQDKVAESASTGHGKRVEQRQRPLLTLEHAGTEATATQAQCAEHAATLGPAGQRADRDFRTQTIMPMRTLLLEHCLRAFMGALSAMVSPTVSVPQVLSLLFARSGSRIETSSQVLYWVNSAGLSLANRRLLREIAQGLCAMGLQEKGKPVHVRLKDLPP